MDTALIVTFFAAPLVSLAVEFIVIRWDTAYEQQGRLALNENGTVRGFLVTEEEAAAGWSTANPHGEFNISAARAARGWPLTGQWDDQPAALRVRLFSQAERLDEDDVASDSPLHHAIVHALQVHQQTELLERWQDGETSTQRFWLATVTNALLWWLMLYALSCLGIGVARLGYSIYRVSTVSREMRRRQAGQCVRCGYDLRGAEFAARCPECGDLVQ